MCKEILIFLSNIQENKFIAFWTIIRKILFFFNTCVHYDRLYFICVLYRVLHLNGAALSWGGHCLQVNRLSKNQSTAATRSEVNFSHSFILTTFILLPLTVQHRLKKIHISRGIAHANSCYCNLQETLKKKITKNKLITSVTQCTKI